MIQKGVQLELIRRVMQECDSEVRDFIVDALDPTFSTRTVHACRTFSLSPTEMYKYTYTMEWVDNNVLTPIRLQILSSYKATSWSHVSGSDTGVFFLLAVLIYTGLRTADEWDMYLTDTIRVLWRTTPAKNTAVQQGARRGVQLPVPAIESKKSFELIRNARVHGGFWRDVVINLYNVIDSGVYTNKDLYNIVYNFLWNDKGEIDVSRVTDKTVPIEIYLNNDIHEIKGKKLRGSIFKSVGLMQTIIDDPSDEVLTSMYHSLSNGAIELINSNLYRVVGRTGDYSPEVKAEIDKNGKKLMRFYNKCKDNIDIMSKVDVDKVTVEVIVITEAEYTSVCKLARFYESQGITTYNRALNAIILSLVADKPQAREGELVK